MRIVEQNTFSVGTFIYSCFTIVFGRGIILGAEGEILPLIDVAGVKFTSHLKMIQINNLNIIFLHFILLC